jgi:hypothetical protein
VPRENGRLNGLVGLIVEYVSAFFLFICIALSIASINTMMLM